MISFYPESLPTVLDHFVCRLPGIFGSTGNYILPAPAHELLERDAVPIEGLLRNIWRHLHSFLALQSTTCQPVSEVLLVEALLRSSNLVLISRPEARAIWRQDFVCKHYRVASTVDRKLELGVCNNDTALYCIVSSLVIVLATRLGVETVHDSYLAVDLKAQVFDLLRIFFTNDLGSFRRTNVLIFITLLGFGAYNSSQLRSDQFCMLHTWRPDRLLQLLALLKSLWHLDTVYSTCLLIL